MYNHSGCSSANSAKWTRNRITGIQALYSFIHLRSFSNKDCLYSNFQHIKIEKHGIFQILYSKQLKSALYVTIIHFNSVFCSTWQNFSQQEKFFSRLTPCASSIVTCIVLWSVFAKCCSQQQGEKYSSAYFCPVNSYIIICVTFVMYWRSLKILPLLTSRSGRSQCQWCLLMCLKALHVLSVLLCTAAPDVCCRNSALVATQQQQHSSLGLVVSWLQKRGHASFGWVKTFPSLKQI